jgi:hypothetical protein
MIVPGVTLAGKDVTLSYCGFTEILSDTKILHCL